MKVVLPYEAEWLTLHKRLSADPRFISKKTGATKLAGLFRPCVSDVSDKEQRVFYIGKATSGPYSSTGVGYPHFNQNGSAFWRFLQRLTADKDAKAASWSNICKIGVTKGNPSEALVQAQKPLAIKTLRDEISHCNAGLLVISSESWQDDIIYSALVLDRGPKDGFGTKRLVHGKPVYIREGDERLPAILWIQHPERKRTELLDEWLNIAQRLRSGAA